jgi:hypothetical protein
MAYASIGNLYREQTVLNYAEAFCLEKVDGCSSWVTFTRDESEYTDNHGVKTVGNFHYHGGNLRGPQLKALLPVALEERLVKLPGDSITVYGEAYGGNIQKCADRYGPTVKFVAFDIRVDGKWLTVPEAEKVALSLGLEFVHYVRIPTKLSEIDFWRDATSEQAIRNGVTTRDGAWVRREGIILRTIDEQVDHRGNRIIAKHKRAEERETKTERVVDTAKLEVLKEARAIAEEWCTLTRLVGHILPKLPGDPVVDMTRTREVISAMLADIHREGAGEFEPGPTVNAEIGKRTAQLLKQHFEEKLRGQP